MTRQSIISVLVVACWIQEACSSLPSSASSTSLSSSDAANGSSAWQWQRYHSSSRKGQTGHSCFLFHSTARKCVRLQQNDTSARKTIEPLGGGIALRASRSTKPKDDSGTASKKGASSSSRGRRMKKSDIDNLVRGIGLEPVATTESSSSPIIDTMSSSSSPTIDGLSSSPEISLQTQLDYSRHGHAVLRSFLPTTLIQNLRSELVPYAAKHALSAWRQKVEVQLADSPEEYHRNNVRSIVDNLTTAEECQELLESFGIDPFDGDLPFLQHFNIWRSSSSSSSSSSESGEEGSNTINNKTPTVRGLCLSPYLAHAASILLDVPSVRLYQDSLFHKRVGDGWTPWHSDARMSPFDTSKMISFWIPLQNVPLPEDGGTGLLFVDGSHSDFALPFWNGAEGNEYDRLENRYGDEAVRHHMPLEVGSVTVHNGWTLHCADSAEFFNEDGGGDRYALSITYVDARAEVREDVVSSHTTRDKSRMKDGDDAAAIAKGDNEDVWSFRSWVGEVQPRTQFRNAQVPIVWPINERECE